MRKIFIALIALVAVSVVCAPNKQLFGGANGEITLYRGSASSQCRIVAVEVENYENAVRSADVTGQCISGVDGTFVGDTLSRLGAVCVADESVGSISTKYYYSPQIPVYKRVNGKKVNLQVSCTGDVYTMGSPLVFGAY